MAKNNPILKRTKKAQSTFFSDTNEDKTLLERHRDLETDALGDYMNNTLVVSATDLYSAPETEEELDVTEQEEEADYIAPPESEEPDDSVWDKIVNGIEHYAQLKAKQEQDFAEVGSYYTKNILSDIASGTESTFMESHRGRMAMKAAEIQELEFQKEFLENQITRSDLSKVVLNGLRTGVPYGEAQDEWRVANNYYTGNLEGYKNLARKYYDEVGHQKTAVERIKAIDTAIKEREAEIKEIGNDLQWWRDIENKHNRIYTPDEEWVKNRERSWVYQIPQGVGTSLSSVATGLAAWGASVAATTAASAYLNVAPGYGTAVNVGAGIIGGTIAFLGTLYARDQESRAEVANAYVDTLKKYAQEHNISIDEIAEAGREKLINEVGDVYDTAVNPEGSARYRDNEAVFEDMLAYNIPFEIEELDALRAESKKLMQDLYDKNMVLMASDLAQTAVLIPGVGKVFSKALFGSFGNKFVDGTVKLMDKAIDNVVTKVGVASAAHTANRYVLDPLLRVSLTGLMEGAEEVQQYVGSTRFQQRAKDYTPYEDINPNTFLPLDLAKSYGENKTALIDGVLGLAGLSNDPALNNSKELSDSFKVGMAVGFLMGGPSQINTARHGYNDYEKGRDIVRYLYTRHTQAKEDMAKYIEYAKKAKGGMVSAEHFLDGIDTQIKETGLPEGMTQEDIDNEKKKIQNIYDLVNRSNVLKKLPKEQQASGAAIIQHLMDREQKARSEFENIRNDQLLESAANTAFESYMQDANLPMDHEHAELIKDYLINVSKRNALKHYISTLTNGSYEGLSAEGVAALVSDLTDMEESFNSVVQMEERALMKAGLMSDEKTDNGIVKRTDYLSDGVSDRFSKQVIAQAITAIQFRNAKQEIDKVKSDPNYLKTLVDKYEQSIADDLLLDQEVKRIAEDRATEEEVVEESVEPATEDVLSPTPVEPGAAIEEPEVIDESEESFSPTPEEDVTENTQEQQEEPYANTEEYDAAADEQSTILEPEPLINDEDYEDYYVDTKEEELTEADLPEHMRENLDTESIINEESLEEPLEIKPSVEEDTLPETEEGETNSMTEESTESLENPPAEQPEVITPEEVIPDELENLTYDPDDLLFEKQFVQNNEEQEEALPEEEDGEATLYFNPVSTTSMFEGYESGKSLDEYISTPGNISNSEFTAFIGDPNHERFGYDPNDVNTWDEAPVYVEIKDPNTGKKYVAALKTISGAQELANRRGKPLSEQQVALLRGTRNQIIRAKLENPNANITFNEVRFTHGLLNKKFENARENGRPYKKAVFRPITEVKGFNLPQDPHDYTNADKNGGIVFGYGRGIRGHFLITDGAGNPIDNSRGGSGKIYIYPSAASSIDGKSRPILLTEQRFRNDDGTPSKTALGLAEMLLYQRSPLEGVPVNDIARLVLNYGKDTVLEKKDVRYDYLKNKQFNIDYSKGYAQLGEQQVPLEELRNEQGVLRIALFIADNLHWNTDKQILFGKLPDSFNTYLEINGENSINLWDEITIDKEDLGMDGKGGLDGISYLIKHGLLKSNLEDQIYSSPFIYVKGPNTDPDLNAGETTEERDPLDEALFGGEEVTLPETEQVKSEEQIEDFEQRFIDFYGELEGGAATRTTDRKPDSKKQINAKKAVKNLKRIFGDELTVEIEEGIMRQMSNGLYIHGLTKRDSILLSSQAEAGSEYHEAWHRVSLLMLNKEQRKKLYDEYRKSRPSYRRASDKKVEEAIAEEFMDYMNNVDTSGLRYTLKKFFRSLKKFIGFNVNTSGNALRLMFDAIRYGDYKNYKLDKESLEEFKIHYKTEKGYAIGRNKDVILHTIHSPYEYQQLLNSLVGVFTMANQVRYVTDIPKMNIARAKAMLRNIQNKKELTVEQKQVLNEVYDKLNVIFEDLIPVFNNMGIRGIDKTENDENNRNATEAGEQPMNQWDKVAFEYNKKENALGNAKLFLHTIPDVRYLYYTEMVDGKPVVKKKLVVRQDLKTGLPLLVDYDTAFSLVLKYLSDVETFAPVEPGEDPDRSLLGKCARLGEKDPFFRKLYNRLCNPKTMDLVTETQMLQTIKSFNQNYEEIFFSKDEHGRASFGISESIHKRAMRIYPSNWSGNFFNSEMVTHSEKESVANAKAITDVVSEFNKIYDDVLKNRGTATEILADAWLENIVSLFNRIGINVNKDAFELMINTSNRTQSIASLILNANKDGMRNFFNGRLADMAKPAAQRTIKSRGISTVIGLDQAFERMSLDSFIMKLAEVEAQLHPLENENFIFGPGGNQMFTKTLNCFFSDQVRWLNNRDKLVEMDLTKNPYSGAKINDRYGSLVLRSVYEEGKKIKLNTFANFYGTDINDSGRSYLDISKLEDYIAKMTLTYNNHMVCPTMADKGTYFTVSGCLLFNEPMNIVLNANGTISTAFNQGGLYQMYKNWYLEFQAIKQYWESYFDISQPVENYHTKNKGGLFRHFDKYYLNGEWISLNQKILAAYEKDKAVGKNLDNVNFVLQEIEQTFFTSPKQTLSKLNTMMAFSTKQELNTCIELGLITVRDGKYTNRYLDNKVLEYFKQIYKAHPSEEVQKNAEHHAIITMIGNHNINYQIGLIEIEKLFTGDAAFYKNDSDQTKRLGAVLSTGDNLRTDWHAPNDLNRSEEEKKERAYLQGRQTYTTTTIKDNKIMSAQYDKMVEMFQKYYMRELLKEKNGLTEKQIDSHTDFNQLKEQYPDTWKMAKSLGKSDADAYGFNPKYKEGNINQADAAVYVSPRMYQDIAKMLGEWNDEIAEAFKIMESGTAWLNNPKLYHKATKALIKPLKTTYFNIGYNANSGVSVPVYNKMAMFPLFKVFATGDLAELYDRMNAEGAYKGMLRIDQVAFESGVKVGIEGKTSFYTDYTNEKIGDLSKMHVTIQRYRNLRRQLLTNPHSHDRTLFGTQVSTIAMSNLILDRVYQQGTENEATGEELRDRMFGTINALSNIGAEKIKKMFLDANGSLDMSKLSKFLINEAAKSNMGKDMEAALALNEKKTDLQIPLSALPDNKWVETKLISSTNKEAVDLNLPGGAFIQMSSFGIKSIKAISEGSYAVNNGDRLLNINEDGSMDAVVSINLLKHIIPGYNKMSFKEARNWLIERGIIGKNASPSALGYRIPTQGMSSVAGIKIADVLPESVGDTIILPDEFTAQTGSDFDIDKLYIARFNYDKKGNVIKFDFSKSYEQNTREANENLLLQTYLNVMTDSKNVGETRLSLDKTTNILKEEVLKLVVGKGLAIPMVPAYEITPTCQMNKKYEFTSGKTGIGPFALNVKNHILTQLVGLHFIQDAYLSEMGFDGLDKIKSQNEWVYQRDDKGNIVLDNNGEPVRILEEGLKILDWLSAMVSAHVDVAKDPFVMALNINQYTYNVANFLLRCGYGKNTFFFTTQPIVKRMAEAYARVQGVYGIDAMTSMSRLLNTEITAIKREYHEKLLKALEKSMKHPGAFSISIGKSGSILYEVREKGSMKLSSHKHFKSLLSRDNLIELLQISQKDKLTIEDEIKFCKEQLLIADAFERFSTYAEQMSKLVQLSLIDTKRYGNNFVEQSRFEYRLNSFINNTTLFDSHDVERYFDNTFLSTKFVNGVLLPSKIFEPLMLRSKPEFKRIVSQALMLLNKLENNDEALNKAISNEFEACVRYGFVQSRFPNLDIHDMFYGNSSMAARLSRIKADILSGKYPEFLTGDGKISNGLLNMLGTLTKLSTDQYNAPAIITKNMSNDDKNLKEVLKQYWQELYESEHEEIKNFARDLIAYSIITTGGNFTKNGVFNLLPIELLLDSGYASYMDSATSNFSSFDVNFDDFFLNNWHNDKIVKPIALTKTVRDKDGVLVTVNRFPVDRIVAPGNAKFNGVPVVLTPEFMPLGRNGIKQNVYTPFIKVKHNDAGAAGVFVYKLIGEVTDEKTHTSKPVYIIVAKKGLNYKGRIVKEYWKDDSGKIKKSVFDFNQPPVSFSLEVSKESLKAGLNKLGIVKSDDWHSSFELIQDYMPVTVALDYTFKQVRLNNNQQQIEAVKLEEVKEATTVEEVKEATTTEVKQHTFTFEDGFTIKTPFKLNQQQQEALLRLEQFAKNPNGFNGNITLMGYAGTGKTTIIGLFDKYLQHIGIRPKYSSPTHRANLVTLMNNPYADVRTMHSLLGLKPEVDLSQAGYDLRNQRTKIAAEAKLEFGDFLIIDESSMITDELFDLLMEFKRNSGISVIFMGDPAQLPPVQDRKTNLSKVFTQQDVEKLELTKVERTGDNPILKECTNLRNGLDLTYQTEMINGQGVIYTPANQQFYDYLTQVIQTNVFDTDPLAFRVLCATNDKAESVNAYVHRLRYGNASQMIAKGEILMGYGNVKIGYDKLAKKSIYAIQNSYDYKVTSVLGDTHISIKTSFGEIKDLLILRVIISPVIHIDGPTSVELSILSTRNSIEKIKELTLIVRLYKEHIDALWEDYNRSSTPEQRRFYLKTINSLEHELQSLNTKTLPMQDFLSENGAVIMKKQIDYGYAHTIHKSQGCTYNEIVVFADGISTFKNPTTQQQLKYVAMSRAKQKVTVVTNNLQQNAEDAELLNSPQESTDQQNAELKEATKVHNETLEVLGGKDDNVAKSELADAVAVAKKGISFELALSTVNPIFTPSEIAQIKKAYGNKLFVKSVSRFTDPVFYADKVIEFLKENAKKSFDDPTRVNAMEIWTKHDGEPLQRILTACRTYKVAPMVSFSITGMGDTALEKGVLKYTDLLPLIKQLIDNGDLDPRTTTVRIDPILAGFTNMDTVRDIVARCKELGLKKFVTSLVQSYGYTEGTAKDRHVVSGINNALAKEGKTYDWEKYYGTITEEDFEASRKFNMENKNLSWRELIQAKDKIGLRDVSTKSSIGKIHFIPKQEYIDEIGAVLKDINKDPEIEIETCSFHIDGLKSSACLDPLIIERITGVDVMSENKTYDVDTSRPQCMCYGVHGDLFSMRYPCYSSCAYCYAGQQETNPFRYYNEDGELQNRPLTRVAKPINVYSADQNGYQSLSNFAERPFTYKTSNGTDITFNSVEQAFQYTKAIFAKDAASAKKILAAKNPADIKRLGGEVKGLNVNDWDRIKYSYMRQLMTMSFKQNPQALNLLLSTKNAPLTHKNLNGVEQYKGEFSRALMTVRDALKNTVNQQQTQPSALISKEAIKVSSEGITVQYGVELTNDPRDFKAKANVWLKSNPNGIVAYRKYGKDPASFTEETVNSNWIGNPFSVKDMGAETVQQFYDWLVTGNTFKNDLATEQFRLAIINKILATPEGSKILYYKELGRPSHATVIGYLINHKELLGGQNQNANVASKKGFVVTPIKAADKKATAKASISNKFIGYADGIAGSSTAEYAKQAAAQGIPVNSGNYNSNDIVFVSIPGKRGGAEVRHAQQRKTIAEALVALGQGATLITDNAQYVENSTYNEGEKELRDALESFYHYSEITVDGQVLGVWTRKPIKDILTEQNTVFDYRKTYSGMITELKPNQIFVFGSNTQGRHGAGSARTARDSFGAVYGQAEGLLGQSYAIITKDLTKDDKKNPSRTREQVVEQINKLYEYAKQNPDKEFLVAYSADGKNLNHYSNEEMASMFAEMAIPENIVFEEEFNKLVNQVKINRVAEIITSHMPKIGPRQLSLFDNVSQEDLNAIEKQKEEHNKKCNR